MSKSKQDLKKEKNESDCFKKAVEIGIKKGGKTAEILRYLNGEDFSDRERNDKPDLVKICTNKNGSKTIVGIEHFYVDQISKNKNGKRVSVGKETQQHIDGYYQTGHNELIKKKDVSEDLCVKLGENVLKKVISAFNYRLNDLIDSLDTAISNHLNSVDSYIDNIISISKSYNIEIAFLIEINLYFPRLFLNEPNGKVIVNECGIPPFINEIVDSLSKIDKKKVKYIVLLLHDYIRTNKSDVVAFESGNVKKHLNNQGYTVYNYVGDDKYTNDTLKHNVFKVVPSEDKQNYHYIYESEINFSKLSQPLVMCIKKAVELKKHNKLFATTEPVQKILYAYGNKIENVYPNNVYPVIELKNGLTLPKEYLDKKEKEFYKKYNIEKYKGENDDQT